MHISIESADVIASMALILSIYATIKTIQFNNRQESLIESQEKLNNLLLEKEASESISEKQAHLGASFIRLGSSKHRLKIWNKGKATARHVLLEFPEENELLLSSEIEDKFPLEALESHQSVELIAAVHLGTKPKHAIRLIWTDDYRERNEKIVYVTL